MLAYILREKVKLTTSEVGRIVGKDHSTIVVQTNKTVPELLGEDMEFLRKKNNVYKKLGYE
jgi:chromosomal replication initiation ATPase DnaA